MLSMDDLLLILNEPESAKETKRTYVRVIVPLPLPKLYTYSVPFHLIPEVKIGVRVEVQLGRNGLFMKYTKKPPTTKPSRYWQSWTRNLLSRKNNFDSGIGCLNTMYVRWAK